MRITNAEALYIHRRRLQLNQAERSEQLDISEWLYVEYETGKRPVRNSMRPRFGRLSKIEKCVVLRKRRGMTQTQLAKRMRCSRLWINKMEQGHSNPGRLIKHWRL